MATRKVTTSYVEVYKVKGETMSIAFNNLKQEKGLDIYHLEIETSVDLNSENIANGAIYKNSKKLYPQYMSNKISEHCIKGALYNLKPQIKDESRVIMHDIVIKGTKQWETINSYRTDSGEVVDEDMSTKADAKTTAKRLAAEKNKTVNVVVSKRLVGTDGIIAVAEFIPVECSDDSNIYVFWLFTTKVEEVDEDELAESHTDVDEVGQLSIKEDLFGYVGRAFIG